MCKYLILYINLFYLLQTTTSQYNYNQYYQNAQQQYYQPKPYVNYNQMNQRLYQQSDQWNTGTYETSSDECTCACNKCEKPTVCCIETCQTSCNDDSQGAQSEVVFVPYPYPLLVQYTINNMQNHTNNTVITTTTTMTTTTTTKPTTEKRTKANSRILSDDEKHEDLEEILRNAHNNPKYMLTPTRRTKPSSMPKYGIVPIPDQLAENLMSHLRDVNMLQARRTLSVTVHNQI